MGKLEKYLGRTVIVALFIFTNCKKDTIIKCDDINDPKCPNYDPCNNKTNASADFHIYENIGNVAVEADTVWINAPLILWARNKPGTTFNWKVKTSGYAFTASDSMITIFGNTQVPAMPTAQFYTVTCIASKNNGDCTSLKTLDSVSKVFYMWPKEYTGNYTNINYLPIWGTYAGYKQSNPNQLVYVTIFDTIYTPVSSCSLNAQSNGILAQYNIIRNLAYNNFSSENYSLLQNVIKYKGASGFTLQSFGPLFYNIQGCYGSKYSIDYSAIGAVDLLNSKKISIDYSYLDTVTWQPVHDFFRGTKIN